ncbi:CsgE family curli-type amyloid fiber assembly protein [Halomonas sp. HK25]|uniref:CsgE family curli-type amyloid fiber assembly protein n=1 Tax=Halomonas sp. HK25 TaxID=3394321 RepID=UPI0039FDA3C8
MRQRLYPIVIGTMLCMLLPTSVPVLTLTAQATEGRHDPGASLEDQHAPERSVEDQHGIVEEPGQAEEELSRQFRLGEPGISGVVVDRTITMAGKTFFRQFSQLSLDNPIIGNANIAIHERPSARWGSQIWITEGNNIIFEATMPPRLSEIDDYVEIAIEQVEELLIQRTIIQALESDPDLADEEI